MEINAITLGVSEMRRSLDFYADALELPVVFGGPDSTFTSLQFGTNFVNLFAHEEPIAFWGRVIVHVDDPDHVHAKLAAAVADGRLPGSCEPHALPQNALWGERYFHVNDPDGHEVSFARPLRPEET